MGTPYQERLSAELWNEYYGVGTAVVVRRGEDETPGVTAGPARVRGGVAVVRMEGMAEAAPLANLRPATYNFKPLASPSLPQEDWDERCPGPM